MMFRKILIANRGEIVNRIIRACHAVGAVPAVVWSKADTGPDYLDTPVEKHLLKGNSLSSTYLDGAQLITVARECGADAIHPGYGFLAENEDFARSCTENGIAWIGPSPEVMHLMSGKESSRQQAIKAGVPVTAAVSGLPGELEGLSGELEYPLLVKAVSGGGGRGMRIIRQAGDFMNTVGLASREAGQYFGDPRVFVERYIENAKHIEVQVLGDKHGCQVHLFERECSIQRRYQKIIEESPSPSLTEGQRAAITGDAVKLAASAGYDSAGTLEFLLAPDGRHFFMEMNTRIQVEHTVTEMVTGIDIVAEQIRSAAGLPLSIRQEDIRLAGNAIECRICAEDPFAGFDPRPGTISLFRAPQGDGIRTDHAIGHGFGVSPMFDSMVAKVITWGPDRKASLEKMRSALKRMVIHGIDSNAAFLRETLNHPVFIGTGFNTSFIASHSPEILQSVTAGKREPPDEVVDLASHLLAGGRPSGPPESRSGLLSPWSTIGYWRIATGQAVEYQGRTIRRISAGGKRKPNGSIVCSTHPDRTVWISLDGHTWQFANPSLTRNPVRKEAGTEEFSQAQPARPAGSGQVVAPLPGLISRLLVREGDRVSAGDLLFVIESMKTENQVLSTAAGRIARIAVAEGQQIRLNEVIMEFEKQKN